MARTVVVMVNYNGCGDTIECLESLLRMDADDFAVVIVDNGSKDGSADALEAWAVAPPPALPPDGPIWAALPPNRRWSPNFRRVRSGDIVRARPDGSRVTLIEAGANLGFAGANNLAMRFAAQAPEVRDFWVLNNDTVVRPDALTRLIAHADAHPEQGLIGTTLIYYHETEIVQGVGGWIDPASAYAGHIGFGLAYEALPHADAIAAELAYVMGASMLARRSVFEATGGMSEDYFLYFEELDWAKRLPAGTGQGVCLDAIVYHKEGGTIGTDSIGRPSDTSLYYYAVNTLRYYWRHERRHVPVAVLRTIWNGIGHARRRDAAAVGVTGRAIADAISGRRRRGPYRSDEFNGRGLG